MFFPILRRRTAAAAVVRGLLFGASGAAAVAPVGAQTTKGSVTKPEITKLTFTGVKSVDLDELRQNLAIDDSHCLSLVLKPICLFTKSGTFYHRAFLDRQELARDMLRARVFYYRRGFRDAQVDTTVTRAGKDAVHVTFTVQEGPPTIVSRLRVEQTTPILTRRDIGRRLDLRRGQPLDLLKLDTTIVALDTRLWDRGYSDAVIDTTITDDTLTHTADVLISVNPRWQAHVASVGVQGNNRVSARTIRKSLSFKPGDLYRRSDLLASQRTLYESQLFRRASIVAPQNDDSLKHVVVDVQEAPPREARYATGFNTVEFVQVQGRYIDHDWLGGAKRLTLDATVGNLLAHALNGNGIFYDVGKTVVGGSASQYLAPTYTVSADARYPWFGSPNNDISVGGFLHRRSAPGVYVDRGFGGTATFTRRLTDRGPASLNYRYEVTRVDAGDVYFCVNFGVCDTPTLSALRNKQRLSPLALTVQLDKTDDPYEPRHGYRLTSDAETANSYTASDFRYNRATGDLSMFLPIGRHSVLGGHVQLGYARALASTLEAVGIGAAAGGPAESILHPRKRFYTGGSNSVRGFGESQLGPKVLTVPASKLLANDSTCSLATITRCSPNTSKFADRDFEPRPLGGNQLIEGNIEFRFPLFTRTILGAVFVDGAYLAQSINPALPHSQTAVTPGFGVRYLSSAGPIRVDVGINPARAEQLQVVTNDPAHNDRLVTLTQTRSYSPSKGTGGFNSVLSRLAVHLSIGEAF
jgi:outer membrane protein insertion porin family